MIAEISLLFDAALAALLAVMIFYSVRLNKRIAMLRAGEGEMLQMIAQFNESSLVAQESARQLKAAGTEAEFGVKAAIAKGMVMRNDLETMLDQAELLVGRLDDDRYRVPAAPSVARHMDPPPGGPMPDRAAIQRELAQRTASPAAAPARPAGRDQAVKPFSPPIRSADEVVRAQSVQSADRDSAGGAGGAPSILEPRTEAERHLLDAIRAAKQGVA